MAFLVSLIATVVAVPLLVRVSPWLGLVDRPGTDPLKIHHVPVPRSGGLAIAAGLAVGLLVGQAAPGPLVFGGLAALLLGLADDRWGLPASLRLLAEAVAAVTTSLLIVGSEGWPQVTLGTLVILVAINAANLFDGLDGLLPGTGAVTAAGLALLLSDPTRMVMWALCGCLIGFLVHNRPPARIFLGDGGAYLVGIVLGMGLLELADTPSRFLGGMVAFGMIGLDFVLTLVRRGRARHPLFTGDRSHLYDQLSDRGWSNWRTLVVVLALHSVLVGLGLALSRLSGSGALIALVSLAALASVVLVRLGFFTPIGSR